MEHKNIKEMKSKKKWKKNAAYEAWKERIWELLYTGV